MFLDQEFHRSLALSRAVVTGDDAFLFCHGSARVDVTGPLYVLDVLERLYLPSVLLCTPLLIWQLEHVLKYIVPV